MADYEEKIKEVFDNLYKDILKRKKILEGAELLEELEIEKAINWLKYVQMPDGFWGYESVAATSEALLALAEWGVDITERWRTFTDEEGSVEKAISWLMSNFEKGSISENLWDTSIALRAFKAYDVSKKKVIEALEWVKQKVFQEITQENQDKLHHIAQALMALEAWGELDNGLETDFIHFLKKVELESQDPYRLGQVLEFIHDKNLEITKIVEKTILKMLNERYKGELDEGNFDNVVSALRGLALRREVSLEGTSHDNEDVVFYRYLHKLIDPSRRKQNGSWYNDPKKTARAIRTISAIKQVMFVVSNPIIIEKKIINAKNEIMRIFSDLKSDYEDLKKNVFYIILLSGLGGFFLTLAVWSFHSKWAWAQTFFEIVFSLAVFTFAAKAVEIGVNIWKGKRREESGSSLISMGP